MMDFANDIPMELAVSAHAGTSLVPHDRGVFERESYALTLRTDYETLAKHATTPELKATLDSEFARYREGYRRHVLAMLASKSRCVSTMVAGPSGFNSRRASKRSAMADARVARMCEYRERALAAMTKVMRPELRPIMAGDDDAVARLREKLAKLEKLQATMKAVNAAIRKHAKKGSDAQVAALLELGFGPEARVREILKPDFAGRVGFADYETKNNGAEIRRCKARLAELERARAQEDVRVDGEHARYEDSPAENRVRLFFPSKPDEGMRGRLKSHGFRWAPSIGAWQAYRNTASIAFAKATAGV